MKIECLLIGLQGKPKAGKTEVANYLARRHNISTHIEMSDQIIKEAKLMLAAIGVNYDPNRKEDFRLLLQWIGHYRRIGDPDYWLRAIDKVEAPASIGGIRYPNEIDRIHQRGGVVWQIRRDLADNHDSAPTEVQLENFSGFDAKLDNNSSLADLYSQVDSLMHSLFD